MIALSGQGSPLAGVGVVARPSPFRLQRIGHTARQGQTVAEILAELISDGAIGREVLTHGEVKIGQWDIPREVWHKVRPRPGRYMMHVSIRPAGGGKGSGGGKSVFGTIAAIALLVVATAVSGGILGPGGALAVSGTLFAAGSTSAALLAAGISVVGALAINALTPTAAADGGAEEEDNAATLGNADFAGNSIGQFEPIPFVLGTHRVAPPHLVAPWTEAINDDQYINAIVGLNGAHRFEDIRVNGTPIDDLPDVEYETRDVITDDSDITLIDAQVFEQQINSELTGHKIKDSDTDELQDETTPANSYPQWIPARSKNSPDEIWLSFFWTGLINQESAGGTNAGGMPLRLRIRRAGDANWINLPEFHAQRERLEPFRGMIKLKFEAAPSSLTRPDQDQSRPPWKYAFYVLNADNSESFDVDSYFTASSAKYASKVAVEDGVAIVYLDPATFPLGVYDVQVKRGWGYKATDFTATTYRYTGSVVPYFFSHTAGSSPPSIRREQSKVACKVSLAGISSVWNEYPLGEKGISLIAVRAKNVSVTSLTAIATSYAHVWNGEDWSDYEPTKNPAALWRELALGGQSVRTPIIEGQIENEALVDWYDYCGDERTNALIFDGSTNYMTRGAGLTGAADSKQFTASIWLYIDADASTGLRWVFEDDTTESNRFVVVSGDVFEITASNSAGTIILRTTSKPLLRETFNHVLVSVDLANPARNHLYVNDADALDVTTTFTNDTIDFTRSNWAVGAQVTGADFFDGMLAEFWFEDGLYLDLTIEANRRKFISANGRPVNLGPTGAQVTGTAPILYLSQSDNNFADNEGTGGNFTPLGSFAQGVVSDSAARPNRECNAYIEGKNALSDILRIVAACGRAASRISDKVGVIVERDRSDQSPIALFTQRNSKGLTIRRAFPRIPDGLRITFNDEDNDYQPTEIYVYRREIGAATEIESVKYVGITKRSEVLARAYLDFRQMLRRPTLYNFETDIENLYCTKGSLVSLSHDTLRRHFDSARVVSAALSGGNLTSLALDSALRFDLAGDALAAKFQNDNYTRLLLHFDGEDGATTITDSSANPKTFTAAGNAQIDTDSKVFGTGALLLDGTGDWVTTPDSGDFELGSSDFMIEARFNCTAALGAARAIIAKATNSFAAGWIIRRESASGLIAVYMRDSSAAGSPFLTGTTVFSNSENLGWHHVRVTRNGNEFKLIVDGQVEDTATESFTIADNAAALSIGTYGTAGGSDPWLGSIDEVRIIVGKGLDEEFTPPTSAYDDPPGAAYLTRDAGLTGVSDDRELTFNGWLFVSPQEIAASPRLVSGTTSLAGSTERVAVHLSSAGLHFIARDASGATLLDVTVADMADHVGRWVHVLASFDLTSAANRFVYIDDAPCSLTVATYTDGDIDFTLGDWAVGARPDGGSRFAGSMAELWFAPGVYLDLSVESNRRKFISANGRPVSLGATGNAPTGTAPRIYLSGSDDNFVNNEGTGGGFTLHGTLGDDAIYYTGSGFPAGVVVQLQDGSTLTAEVDEEGQSATATFVTPQPLPDYLTDSGAWATATAYEEGDVVANDGAAWTAIADHTSGASTEPGTGSDWFDYWEPLLSDCLVAAGPFSSIEKRMLVLGIKPTKDLGASITLIDEAATGYIVPPNSEPDRIRIPGAGYLAAPV